MEEAKINTKDYGVNLEQMQKAGLYFGHKASKTHPKMKKYISGIKNDIHMVDLEKSAEELKKAMEFVEKLVQEGKILLLVGTKIQTKKMAEELGREIGIPFISERWLGGTFTNFDTIKKRVAYLKELERKRESGELVKYTKKERAHFDKEIKDLERKIGGIKNMDKLPDAVFVLDMKKDFLAVKEARMKRIPVVAIADTNVDPSAADYVIPANDDAISSVKYILELLKEVVLKTKSEIPSANPEKIPNNQ